MQNSHLVLQNKTQHCSIKATLNKIEEIYQLIKLNI